MQLKEHKRIFRGLQGEEETWMSNALSKDKMIMQFNYICVITWDDCYLKALKMILM